MSSTKCQLQSLPDERSEIILKAAYRMARTMVHLFGPHLSVEVMADLVRQAGVEITEARCKKEDPKAKVTLSKLSLMTGIPTSVIKNIQRKPKAIADYHVCAEAAILARWSKDPALRSQVTNQPVELPIFGVDGSFQSLVNRHAGRGISTRTALDRLVASGNVEVVGKHFVKLVDANWRFIEDNEDEFLDYGTQAIACLAKSVQHNLENRNNISNKVVERRIYSARIPRNLVAQVRQEINEILVRQKSEMAEFIRSKESQSAVMDTMLIGAGYYNWYGRLEDGDLFVKNPTI